MLSLMAFFENLGIFAPVVQLVLLFVGFVGSAWVTNGVAGYFRPDLDEVTKIDQAGTFILLTALFASYCYFITALFPQ